MEEDDDFAAGEVVVNMCIVKDGSREENLVTDEFDGLAIVDQCSVESGELAEEEADRLLLSAVPKIVLDDC